MRFVDLEPEDPRLATDVLPVLAELRTHLTPQLFTAVYAEGYPQGCALPPCTTSAIAVSPWQAGD